MLPNPAKDTKVSYIQPETQQKTPKSHTFSQKPRLRHQSLIHSAVNPAKGTKVSYIQPETNKNRRVETSVSPATF